MMSRHCFSLNLVFIKFLILCQKSPVKPTKASRSSFSDQRGTLFFQQYRVEEKNKNPKDHIGYTPLHKAAYGGAWKGKYKHPEICRLILKNLEEKNPQNREGKTPLLLAIESNHSSVIDILTPKYIKKRKTNEEQNSAKGKHLKNE